jgi:hypothetical protein
MNSDKMGWLHLGQFYRTHLVTLFVSNLIDGEKVFGVIDDQVFQRSVGQVALGLPVGRHVGVRLFGAEIPEIGFTG